MNNNKKYFMEELGLKHDVFQPRLEAVAYKSQQDAEKAVLSFIEREFAQLEDSKEKVFILLHKYFSLETRLQGKGMNNSFSQIFFTQFQGSESLSKHEEL